ncbi:MAG: T9SS C-terminal target domain-containing protein [Chitinophagaceae bacterium]|nr:MAG: T9SS C-terminal target domain-containing protein [Chitinophagaceae bacterium]
MNTKKTLAFILAAMIVIVWSTAQTNISQPPPGHTGAPGELTCATAGCHGGSATFNNAIATINTAPPGLLSGGYNPGQEYNITVTNNAPNRSLFGFSLVAIDDNGNQAGKISLSNPTKTSLVTVGGKEYVGHRDAIGDNAWVFKWEAPDSDVGTISFHVATNASTGGGVAAGNIFTGVLKVTTEGILTSDNLVAAGAKNVQIYPNPASEFIKVNLENSFENNPVFNLYNTSGKLVQQFENLPANYQLEYILSLNNNLNTGLYFLEIKVNEKQEYFKVFIR